LSFLRQLGRMIVEDGLRYNPHLKFSTLGTAGMDSPAAQVGAVQMEGGLKDPDAIRALVEKSDVTTLEIEHVNADILIQLEDEGHNIQPSPRSLLIVQDKVTQKQHLMNHGIPVAAFAALFDWVDLAAVRSEFGDELMVKTRRGGYDGRGNYKLEEHENWDTIDTVFRGDTAGSLYAEKLVPFKRELALVGVRDMLGTIATYPVVETIHKNNICHTVFCDSDRNIPKAAEEIGRATISTFQGAGVFAVEMFETDDGEIIVNEVAPRVHNSGHWTDVGAETSQFEQHVRAISGASLGSTQAKAPAIMINILGTKDAVFQDYMRETQTLKNGVGHVRWYGKAPRPGVDRKIGHVTAIGDSPAEALERANRLMRAYA
jgi:phosphoribosylaminoimidazole carboxylase